MASLRIVVFVRCLSAVMPFPGCAPNVVITPDIAIPPVSDTPCGAKLTTKATRSIYPTKFQSHGEDQ